MAINDEEKKPGGRPGKDVWGIERDARGESNDRASWIKLVGFVVLTLSLTYVWMAFNSRITVRDKAQSPAATPWTVQGLEGGPVALASLQDRLLVVNLWAAWCGPCRAEIPALEQVQDELGDQVRILGVNVDARNAEELAAESEPLAIRYPVWFAPEGFPGIFGSSNSIPQTFLIDREGRVRADIRGKVSARALLAACREILEERSGS